MQWNQTIRYFFVYGFLFFCVSSLSKILIKLKRTELTQFFNFCWQSVINCVCIFNSQFCKNSVTTPRYFLDSRSFQFLHTAGESEKSVILFQNKFIIFDIDKMYNKIKKNIFGFVMIKFLEIRGNSLKEIIVLFYF